MLSSSAPNTTLILQSDDTGLQIHSLLMQSGAFTLQGPSTGAKQELDIADGATFNVNDGYLFICPDSASVGADSLKLKFLGTTTQSSSGAGSLSINTLTNLYTSSLPSLQTYHISHSVLRIGVSADLSGTLFQIDAGSGIVVQDAVNPTVGSVTGDGNLQFGETASTGLTIATPQGRTDLFSGTILGVGGTLTKSGAGQLTIGDLNAGGAGAFSVNVQSGTLLGTGVIKAQQVNVSAGASFGGTTTATVGQAVLSGGGTFVAALNGTGTQQYTSLTGTGTTSPITLGGATLAISLGYTPTVGDTFTILSAPHGITGQFGNAARRPDRLGRGYPLPRQLHGRRRSP